MIQLRNFLLVSFLLHQGVVSFALIDNTFAERLDQGKKVDSVQSVPPTKERAPKDLGNGRHANEVMVDASVAYEDGVMDGITLVQFALTLTLIFVSLAMLIGCVSFLLAIYYSKRYGYLKRADKKISQNLESVKVEQRH